MDEELQFSKHVTLLTLKQHYYMNMLTEKYVC